MQVARDVAVAGLGRCKGPGTFVELVPWAVAGARNAVVARPGALQGARVVAEAGPGELVLNELHFPAKPKLN